MKKNIYQLLNEVETDFREYEQAELSSREKEYHKQRFLMEVKRMNKTNRKDKNRKTWKIAAGMAAACVLTVGVTGMGSWCYQYCESGFGERDFQQRVWKSGGKCAGREI